MQREEHLREHPDSPLKDGFIWSFDNPTTHDADLAPIGIIETDRCELAPASGDMHKCIEHAHGTLQEALLAWAGTSEGQRKTKPSELWAKVEELWVEKITPKHVAADVASLPRLWRYIRDNNGDYPPSHLRLALLPATFAGMNQQWRRRG